jgi:hypothetical protein
MSCETISCETQQQTVDCPICMECITGDKNKVITECGHCFHTKCLMTNVLHNGFGCPYCRKMMVDEEPESDEDEISVISVEDSINSSMRGRTEEEYNDYLLYNSTLSSVRNLFREEGEQLEEVQDEEEEEDTVVDEPKPPIEFLAQKMEEQGFTIERFVKSWLVEHDEYDDIEEECDKEADDIFEALRILISNYEAPAVVAEPVAVVN